MSIAGQTWQPPDDCPVHPQIRFPILRVLKDYVEPERSRCVLEGGLELFSGGVGGETGSKRISNLRFKFFGLNGLIR